MHELVIQLYTGNWSGSVSKVTELVAPSDAPQLVRELTLCKGWRERVVAAKIACAFELHELVGPLIRTFAAGPETYTAAAFARLISSLRTPEALALLVALRQACPANAHGKHLLEVIERASGNESEA